MRESNIKHGMFECFFSFFGQRNLAINIVFGRNPKDFFNYIQKFNPTIKHLSSWPSPPSERHLVKQDSIQSVEYENREEKTLSKISYNHE